MEMAHPGCGNGTSWGMEMAQRKSSDLISVGPHLTPYHQRRTSKIFSIVAQNCLRRSYPVAQPIKDPMLSLQWLGYHGMGSIPGLGSAYHGCGPEKRLHAWETIALENKCARWEDRNRTVKTQSRIIHKLDPSQIIKS